MKIILFIVGIIILVSGFGYLGYVVVQKKKEKEYSLHLHRQALRQSYAPPVSRTQQPTRPIMPAAAQQKPLAGPLSLRDRTLQKDAERKKLFEGFETGQKQKSKEEKIEPKPEAKQKTASPKANAERKNSRRQQKAVKPKEDVFAKLKSIAQERKKTKKIKSK